MVKSVKEAVRELLNERNAARQAKGAAQPPLDVTEVREKLGWKKEVAEKQRS